MMRGIAALFLLSLLSLAAAQSPSDAALGYLRQVAAGEGGKNLAKNTALSEEVTRERLEEIRDQVGRLKESLAGAELRILDQKEEGDLAAVLVTQQPGPDTEGLEIYPIGLVRRNDLWLPAPLPGSFENTGLNFDPVRRPQAKALEEWMIRTRSQQLVGLREAAQKTWEENLRKAVPREMLEGGKPEELVEALIAAMVRGDQPAVYALLGGEDAGAIADWTTMSKAVFTAMTDRRKAPEIWNLVTQPEVLRAVVQAEPGPQQGTVTMVCLRPGQDGRQRPRALHFTVTKEGSGLWRVELPEALLNASRDREEAEMQAREADAADAEFIGLFPETLRAKYPAAPVPAGEAGVETLAKLLRESTLESAVPLLEISATSKEGLGQIMKWAAVWEGLHSSADQRGLLPLAVVRREDEVCGIYQFFSSANAPVAEFVKIYFRHGPGGWMGSVHLDKDPAPGSAEFATEVAATSAELMKDWSKGLFTQVAAAPLAGDAPTEEAARDLLTRWQAARSSGDVAAMVGMVAAVGDANGTRNLLRNLGYEVAGKVTGTAGAIYRSGGWACVGVEIKGIPVSYGLYPVVTTPAGPRILLEVYLRAAEGKTADILNGRALQRAGDCFTPDASGRLERCLGEYRAALSAASH